MYYFVAVFMPLPLPSLVLALRTGGAGGGSTGAGGGAIGAVTSDTMLSTTDGMLAVARAALVMAAPLRGLLVLNSRHFAPSTIIIFDTAIDLRVLRCDERPEESRAH